MRILGIAVALVLVASNAGAFNEIHLKKLKMLNACENCDLRGANLVGVNLSGANLYKANLLGANLYKANLSGAKLRGANFSGADLSIAVLWNANTKGAVFCKTKTPWGVDNSGCKKAK